MSRRPSGAPSGLLVIDKPAGMTSHDVVSRLRRLAGTRRVGHAGTLDPAATGVLLVGVERATRLLTHLVGAEKEYLATVRFGVATHTDDAEGDVLARADASHLTRAHVERAAAALTGALDQVPSSVSAKKVDGQRAHALVRAGQEVVLEARPVVVSAFEVLDVRPARDERAPGVAALDADVRVVVSSGTYVRALARDAGAALGVGGSLTALRRTRVGGYRDDVAASLEQLAEDGVDAHRLDLATAAGAEFPLVAASDAAARRLAMGQRLSAADLPAAEDGADGAGEQLVAVRAGEEGPLVALVRLDQGVVRPVLVLAEPRDLP
ncbi:tRNA pseudouridine(55) synthase TruB [Quadrisphaera sp. INWT6]|uniref:tRNA pseudouridine(55) synthase TruB n=1 Tax=Quadrisphaera sp. INWT6 TaxID=2596917 RepID=UPI001DB255B6|nr:tRNA pseudouridine(55) synthase TruB [Quadrisphaera sp. INWT6]MBF5080725.1 tRNA pseudouridine(55) synthase TruB [Quadrisphaera sp. INWT6]